MGLKEDYNRFVEIGENRRQDLKEFIKHGELGDGERIKVPIKIITLPEFTYSQRDSGGIGQGGGDVGDPVDVQPSPGDGDGDGEGDGDGDGDGKPGEGEGEHDYYEMDPEEFAQELDEELGLELEPKGKNVSEVVDGDYTELSLAGPDSTLDFERMFKKGLKRKMAMFIDKPYLTELLKVSGFGPERAFSWARERNVPVGRAWLDDAYDQLSSAERTTYNSVDDIPLTLRRNPGRDELKNIPLRAEDKRFRHPSQVEKKEKNVVVINIRDVSGSMNEDKRELVERVFTPLDWYLTGKYDTAEFHYIAHDFRAWETEREDFFGVQSGGGTEISQAYLLAQEILKEYPWSEWNRYVFAAGDGENKRHDTRENVIPLMEEIDANLHAYVEASPNSTTSRAVHRSMLTEHFDADSNVTAVSVKKPDDTIDAIYDILNSEK